MRNVIAVSVAAAALLALGSVEAQRTAAPRLAPVAASEQSPQQRTAIEAFAPIGMPNLAATYAHHPALPQILLPHLRYIVADLTLAAGLGTPQVLDVIIAEDGYRSTSILINTAGVQLDANMAEFRFPPELR